MNIIGIDTSCDDTSAAVISNGHQVLSNVIHSQVRLHHPYGGVVPELASREHIRNIVPVVHEAISRANLEMTNLDGVGVTVGPGLIGSLLVGLYYAKALAFVNHIPLVAVNHLEGHILSVLLEDHVPSFPFVALTVSGGHTSLYYVKGYGDYVHLGRTLDDAAGEAFDKVAKILELGYPGGPVIEKLARAGKKDRIPFPRAYLDPESDDFSFSGLKTSVSLYVKKWRKNQDLQNSVCLEDIAASFQEAVIDVLIEKLIKAGKKRGVDSLAAAGGVACNSALRQRLDCLAEKEGMNVFYPRPEYCTDNGAMIGLVAHHRMMRGEHADMSIDVKSRFQIEALDRVRLSDSCQRKE